MSDAIARLRKLHEAATPGPWTPPGVAGLDWTIPGQANAALIAAVRNALPGLLAVAEAAEKVTRDFPTWSMPELRAALAKFEGGAR